MLKDKNIQYNTKLLAKLSSDKDLPSPLSLFIDCYHFHEAREMLWDWLVIALSSDKSTYASGTDRSNLLFFYENLLMLLEEVYQAETKGRQRLTNGKNSGRKKLRTRQNKPTEGITEQTGQSLEPQNQEVSA